MMTSARDYHVSYLAAQVQLEGFMLWAQPLQRGIRARGTAPALLFVYVGLLDLLHI